MPQYIIHKDGAFNVFSTVVDAPLLDQALAKDELAAWFRDMHGESVMNELSIRIDRAVAAGTSALTGITLEELISFNRAGQNEKMMQPAEFIDQFLTLVKA